MAITARAVLMAASCGSEMRRDDALMAIRPALRLSITVLFHNSHEKAGQQSKFNRSVKNFLRWHDRASSIRIS
jgi:hypothetical protein